MSGSRKYSPIDDYHVRILGSLAASLLLFVVMVNVWPSKHDEGDRKPRFRVHEQEAIAIDEIKPTRQSNQKPPPPAPPIPVVIPNETVLDDVELDLSESVLLSEDDGVGTGLIEGPDNERSTRPSGPTVGPKTVRFVEPEYTREARRKRVRAELVVEVLVDQKGRVRRTEIVERFLLDKEGSNRTPVELLGYGLEEAAISAAERWVFRPARRNGEPVESVTTLTFTFGV